MNQNTNNDVNVSIALVADFETPNVAGGILWSYEYFEGDWTKNCEPLVKYCSNEWLVLPAKPIMYNYFQFIYLTNRSVDDFKKNVAPDFVCFDAKKCPSLSSNIHHVDIIDGLTCCHISNLTQADKMEHFHDVTVHFSNIYNKCSKTGIEKACANSSYFHCDKSLKCLSYHRVGDGHNDCYDGEDESFPACQLNDSKRFLCIFDQIKCLLPVALGDEDPNCPKLEIENSMSRFAVKKQVSFQALCDSYTHPVFSKSDDNETDETNCELWPCHNPYTHCNARWSCLNGIDELNCPNMNCSFNQFQCKNEISDITYCLPLSHMLYKQIENCTELTFIYTLYFNNETNNIGKEYYSFNASQCIREGNICRYHSKIVEIQQEMCLQDRRSYIEVSGSSNVFKVDEDNTYLCTIDTDRNANILPFKDAYFVTSSRLGYFPPISSPIPSIQNILERNENDENLPQIDGTLSWYCHQGILVLFGINQTKTCLCPPNYFGSQCQWQNQRISLTLQLKMQSIISKTVIFQLIIMLIDENGIIAPNYEQITYISVHHCNTKFNVYLPYPDRPKRLSDNFSIRIDLFDKITLDYWNTWYISIPFQFLPVNRISTQLIIPKTPENHPCSLPCGEHGRCVRYTNMKSLSFCLCDQNYSGSFCNITYHMTCLCSNDSLCLASFICVCPLNKFGLRCYLKRSICHSTNNPCQHNGTCIPTDDRIDLHSFICFCKEGYTGERCQFKGNQIDIQIDETLLTTDSIFLIHYITAFERMEKHERTTILKKIAFDQNTITVDVPQSFNILFFQISSSDYYLAVLREKFIQSEYIFVKVLPKQRCPFIRDFNNETFLRYHYMHRVKYYPLLCRQNLQLMCFYDEYNMCICDSDRFSNCFQFDNTKKHYCQGENPCENDGQCFQNNATCPSTFICSCQDCYYGDQCQFSTKDYVFSLDPILGYHIKPNVPINRQPFIVKLSIAISTIMLIFGLIIGSLSVATFQLQKSREVGCGYYLLASSITSICMIIIFTIKFWHLVLSQMSIITNRSMLLAGCVSIEMILKVLLSSSEWFNTCVACERMINVIHGVKFNKKNSKKIAKRMIFVVFIFTTLTHVHDPLNRHLIDDLDGDQRRIWCITKYSSSIITYNSFITLFHFLGPFSTNFISSLLLIITAARMRLKAESKKSFKQHFKLQLQQHKHLLIASIALILLGLPRLIISFIYRCMRTAHKPWFYFIGYFLSFLPTMLTFFVFVLPSTIYKSEFDKIVKKTIRQFYSSP